MKIKEILNVPRLLPHFLTFLVLNRNNKIIFTDMQRWANILLDKKLTSNIFEILLHLLYLMTYYPEFRNLFYYRVKQHSSILASLLSFLCKPLETLHLYTPNIGEGLFIQHGFATIVAASKIGKNCWINQQVTIGFSDKMHQPTLGDNVIVHAGAIIVGGVCIRNNVKIGANAVVVKNVPDNCTVVGVPAYIIRKNGIKVFEKL